jgi:23S rRNA (cytosine1962-C5)-methyltransferase
MAPPCIVTSPVRTSRLKLQIRPAAEISLRQGHPWVFANSIQSQNREGTPGELAVIYDRHNRFLAIGFFDPDSPIRVRVLHTGKPLTLDDSWWATRLDAALERRQGLFDSQTTGFRWINGESDGWPGLVLDRYGDALVLKLYTVCWLPRLADLQTLILKTLSPKRLVLRLSRNVLESAHRALLSDGMILHGPPLNEPVTFLESGLRFEADVVRGQKTGFFLDQRENRRQVAMLANGARVLNAFSFSGGFSLYAARGGARRVTDLDISAHALDSARRNFALNTSDPGIEACVHELVQADTFEWLPVHCRDKYDLIILDPPSLAKRESERKRAIAAYQRLVSLALPLLAPGGTMVACSCSAHVSEPEFFNAVRKAVAVSRRRFSELITTAHAPDHPALFPESRYLKGIYLRSS